MSHKSIHRFEFRRLRLWLFTIVFSAMSIAVLKTHRWFNLFRRSPRVL